VVNPDVDGFTKTLRHRNILQKMQKPQNQNHNDVLYYERSLRNIEGNQDIIATLIWVTARTSLGTTDLRDAHSKHREKWTWSVKRSKTYVQWRTSY